MLPTDDTLAQLHDLGNLLTVIDATTERLRIHRAHDRSCDALIGDLAIAVKRASEIIWEMKRGVRDAVERVETDIVEFVRRLERSLAIVVGARIALTVESKIGGVRVMADRRMLEQALYNLVWNARDAMGTAGGAIAIAIEVLPARGFDSIGNELPAADYAAVSVRDSGPGFNVASVPKLFEPFFTTKPAGTGLGLRLVADVARGHGGGVFVVSEPGRGATFTLVVPVAPAGSTS